MKNGKNRAGAAVLTLMLLAAAVWQFQPGGMADHMARTDGEPTALPGVQAVYAAQEDEAGQDSGGEQTGDDSDASPVYGYQVADGEYEIEVESSSSMFRVTKAVLTVKDGQMSAVLTLGGTGYGKLFMGTGDEAAAAGEESCIPFAEDETGAYTYEVPVEVLNQPVDCAAWSIRKEQWYDRELVFLADSLPQGAVQTASAAAGTGNDGEKADSGTEETGGSADTSQDMQNTAASGEAVTDAPDGVYQLEVTLGGGSGKAEIASPAEVTVADGRITARIEWSSPNYDYMVVNGVRCEPVNEEGNSVFEIPVPVLDEAFEVTADTTAMSTPHEIDYTLTFDSSGLDAAESGISPAVIVIILIAALAALAAGIFTGRRIRSKKNRGPEEKDA